MIIMKLTNELLIKKQKEIITKIEKFQDEMVVYRKLYVGTEPLDAWNAKAHLVFSMKHLDAVKTNLQKSITFLEKLGEQK